MAPDLSDYMIADPAPNESEHEFRYKLRNSQWLARGRPTLGDYGVAFVPIGEEASAPSGGWALDRRFFRELVWLELP